MCGELVQCVYLTEFIIEILRLAYIFIADRVHCIVLVKKGLHISPTSASS